MARRPGHRAYPGRTVSPPDAGQDRALASDAQEPSPARKLLSTGRPRGRGGRLRRALQSRPLPRKPPQSHPRGRLLRTRPNHPPQTGKDQTTDDRQSPLAAPREGRLTSKPDEPEPPLLKPAPRLKLSDDGHPPSSQPLRSASRRPGYGPRPRTLGSAPPSHSGSRVVGRCWWRRP